MSASRPDHGGEALAGAGGVSTGTSSGTAYDGARGAQLATTPVYLHLGGGPEARVTADVYATGTATLAIGGGPLAIDPATYARTGLTAAFHLVGTGFTDNASRTATLTLWDLTTDAAVATATFNNATTPAAFTPATATLNATPHVYEVRFSVSGTLVTHTANVNNVSLRITWS